MELVEKSNTKVVNTATKLRGEQQFLTLALCCRRCWGLRGWVGEAVFERGRLH